ncbi:unnamed protein product [Pleuronectes platessa]|uniref:Uncharacterized protein n=1 Tax=Pleuronectes platessa TaxID=8262 RepID=A0A9N7V4B6_PLEPL|nr:unnamed protein product [Pleuronectes platessa]
MSLCYRLHNTTPGSVCRSPPVTRQAVCYIRSRSSYANEHSYASTNPLHSDSPLALQRVDIRGGQPLQSSALITCIACHELSVWLSACLPQWNCPNVVMPRCPL